MGKVESYRDMKVWQVGMEYVAACYSISGSFPKAEARSDLPPNRH